MTSSISDLAVRAARATDAGLMCGRGAVVTAGPLAGVAGGVR